jgi:hypothetical protein
MLLQERGQMPDYQTFDFCDCSTHHVENAELEFNRHSITGLPDISWQNIPKREKYIPNDHDIYQMASK